MERREEVLGEMTHIQDRVRPLTQIIEDEDTYVVVRSLGSIAEIVEKYDLPNDIMDALFSYAKFQYQCGDYKLAVEILKHYRVLTAQDTARCDTSIQLAALWGTLACHILNGDWEFAGDIISKLDEAYEASNLKLTRYELVLNRGWLLHWTIFLVFKSDNPSTQKKAMDFFLLDRSLQIVAVACQHLLRYVAALLILHRHLQDHRASELLNRIRQDRFWYSDPITQFLEALYFDLDFEAAQTYLNECGKVLAHDYFLSDLQEEFAERCRLLIFETYCRIHQHIDLRMIADKLSMTPEDAEVWIVKLIQHAKLDATIDSEKNRVLMAKQQVNVYQQVLEKTKNVGFRSLLLNSNIDKRMGTNAGR